MEKVDVVVLRKLRERTGAGISDCQVAIRQANGNFDKAVEVLRKKGTERMIQKNSRIAKEGCIAAYIHSGGKIGVLIEVNCETDFVARTDDFQQFAKDLTLQITATNPLYLDRDKVPPEVLAKEKEILISQITGKPPSIVEKILEGKLEKYYEETCLLEQLFIKDPSKRIRDYLVEVTAKLGEKIVIQRFVRFQLGETQEA